MRLPPPPPNRAYVQADIGDPYPDEAQKRSLEELGISDDHILCFWDTLYGKKPSSFEQARFAGPNAGFLSGDAVLVTLSRSEVMAAVQRDGPTVCGREESAPPRQRAFATASSTILASRR